MREELSTRLNSSNTMEIIKEKEEQIMGLLEEGKLLLLSPFKNVENPAILLQLLCVTLCL